MTTNPLPPFKLAYSPAEAAEAAGVGRTLLFEEIRNQRLVARKVGRRTLIEVEELQRWIRSLPIRASEFA
jgi:excisionase family DNA binding protein